MNYFTPALFEALYTFLRSVKSVIFDEQAAKLTERPIHGSKNTLWDVSYFEQRG